MKWKQFRTAAVILLGAPILFAIAPGCSNNGAGAAGPANIKANWAPGAAQMPPGWLQKKMQAQKIPPKS